MKLVGIAGRPGSGKTTIVHRLRMLLAPTTHVKFADIIYKMHDAIRTIGHHYDLPVKEKDRQLLQFLGTEWGRQQFGEDVWVNALLSKYDKVKDDAGYMLVDDVRYVNELEAIQSVGGQVIWLEVPEKECRQRIPYTYPEVEHTSEGAFEDLDMFDLTLDGTQEVSGIASFLARYLKGDTW